MERGNFLKNEVAKRAETIALLESTEGYQKLTEKQKQIIRVSLFIQSRALRKSDPTSIHAIQLWPIETTRIAGPWELRWKGLDPKSRKYPFCQNHMSNWNCHAAINALETGIIRENSPGKFSPDFFDAEYFKPKDIEDIKTSIEKVGFPAVIHTATRSKNNYWASVDHSFLALGYARNEEKILVWEKKGFFLPYRVIDISEALEFYMLDFYWGVRKLKQGLGGISTTKGI